MYELANLKSLISLDLYNNNISGICISMAEDLRKPHGMLSMNCLV